MIHDAASASASVISGVASVAAGAVEGTMEGSGLTDFFQELRAEIRVTVYVLIALLLLGLVVLSSFAGMRWWVLYRKVRKTTYRMREASGKIQFDEKGPFISTGDTKHYIDGMFPMTSAPFSGRRPETVLEGSFLFSCEDMPKCIGQIVVNGENGFSRIVGMFSRISYNGKDCLLTAYHVLSAHRGKILCLASERGGEVVTLPFDTKWVAAAMSKKMDVAIIEVPSSIFSVLGIARGEVDAHPHRNTPVFVFGFDGEKKRFGRGMMSKDSGLCVSYGASTLPSWSGSPIMDARKRILGVHVAGGVDMNYGMLIFPLFRRLETDYADDEYKEDDVSEEEADEQYEVEGRKAMTIRTRDRFYNTKVADDYGANTPLRPPGQNWFDIVDNELGSVDEADAKEDAYFNNQTWIGSKFRKNETIYSCNSCKKITDLKKCPTCATANTALPRKMEREMKNTFINAVVESLKKRYDVTPRLQYKLERTLNNISADHIVGLRRRARNHNASVWPSNVALEQKPLGYGNMTTIAKEYSDCFAEYNGRIMDDSENTIFLKSLCDQIASGRGGLTEVITQLNWKPQEKQSVLASAPPQYENVGIYPKVTARIEESLNLRVQNGQGSGAPSIIPGEPKKTEIVGNQPSVSRRNTANLTKPSGTKSKTTSLSLTAIPGPIAGQMLNANPSTTKIVGEQLASAKPKRQRRRKSKKQSSGSTVALTTSQ